MSTIDSAYLRVLETALSHIHPAERPLFAEALLAMADATRVEDHEGFLPGIHAVWWYPAGSDPDSSDPLAWGLDRREALRLGNDGGCGCVELMAPRIEFFRVDATTEWLLDVGKPAGESIPLG